MFIVFTDSASGFTGSSPLSCVCNVGFQQTCASNPVCPISGEYAHCIIEVQSSDMEIVFQGCSDLVLSYFTCVGQVTENNGGRLIMCCATDNCNTLDALREMLGSSTSTSSTTVPPQPSTVHVTEFPTVTSKLKSSEAEFCAWRISFSESCMWQLGL